MCLFSNQGKPYISSTEICFYKVVNITLLRYNPEYKTSIYPKDFTCYKQIDNLDYYLVMRSPYQYNILHSGLIIPSPGKAEQVVNNRYKITSGYIHGFLDLECAKAVCTRFNRSVFTKYISDNYKKPNFKTLTDIFNMVDDFRAQKLFRLCKH